MPLALAAVFALSLRCAPQIAPSTLVSIAKVESGLDPLAIGINGVRPQHLSPPSVDAAVDVASRLLAEGRNLDLGLAQINSTNLARLGLSLRGAFEPCRNLAAASVVLKTAFQSAATTTTDPQAALRIALSRYNSGDPLRGFHNGYVTRVEAAAAATTSPSLASRAATIDLLALSPAAPLAVEAQPAWAVFGRPNPTSSFVLNLHTSGDAP